MAAVSDVGRSRSRPNRNVRGTLRATLLFHSVSLVLIEFECYSRDSLKRVSITAGRMFLTLFRVNILEGTPF